MQCCYHRTNINSAKRFDQHIPGTRVKDVHHGEDQVPLFSHAASKVQYKLES